MRTCFYSEGFTCWCECCCEACQEKIVIQGYCRCEVEDVEEIPTLEDEKE
jgi:hypothetical protein